MNKGSASHTAHSVVYKQNTRQEVQIMANIKKKYSLNAKGILAIDDSVIGIENIDTGEFFNFQELLADFADKSVNLTINYDEEYGTT